MLLKRFLSVLLSLSLLVLVANHPVQPSIAQPLNPTPDLQKVQKALTSQSSFFTENKGQWDPSILFVGNTSFGKIAFTKEAIYYQMIKVTEKEIDESKTNSMTQPFVDSKNQKKYYQSQTVKLSFVNPNAPVIEGTDVLTHYNNYFIGNDPKKWASNCRNFAKVTYQDVWQGIDLAYFFTPEGLKYEYYVDPVAKIQDLQIKVEGADLLNRDSTLQIITSIGTIQDTNLLVFEEDTIKIIQADFSIDNNIISFQDIPLLRTKPIVIDPLLYSTYLGGSGWDYSNGIEMDANCNVFILGNSQNSDFASTAGVLQGTNKGSNDVFLSKFDLNMTTLQFTTFLGGSGVENGLGLAVDSSGNSYITGYTQSSDFPVTAGAFQTSYKGNYYTDAFVSKINSTGTSLSYSTYMTSDPGNNYNEGGALGYKIRVDSSGNAYICGSTTSKDFPTTSGAYQTTYKNYRDVIVFKLNSTGSSLVYSTYIGGSSDLEEAYDIRIDSSGNAYITGKTCSDDFPVTTGSYQTSKNGYWDAFVTKLNADGSKLLYSTYLGGSTSDQESGFKITVDNSGNAYVAGYTESNDFPITSGVYQSINNNGWDTFISKLNSTGSSLLFSSYLGGSGNEFPYSILLDSSANIYILGATSSSDWPTSTTAIQNTLKGSQDSYIVKLNSTCTTLLFSTYFGGSDIEFPYGGAIFDSSNNIIFSGYTTSIDYPITSDAYQATNKGNSDAFISKFSFESTGTATFTSKPTSATITMGGVVKGITPLTLSLPPGSYSATYSLPGYQNASKSFTITAGTDTPIYVDLIKATNSGVAAFTSRPSGATVTIGGVYRGTTPLSIALPPDTYTATIALTDYPTLTPSFTITTGKTTTVYSNLTGTAALSSRPTGATITIGGTVRGTTPLNLFLAPGTYDVTFSMAGYPNYTQSCTIVRDQTTTVYGNLTGTAAFTSKPIGATITIGGVVQGVTPLNVFLAPGTYSATFSKSGYQDKIETFTVVRNLTVTVLGIMTPSTILGKQPLLLRYLWGK